MNETEIYMGGNLGDINANDDMIIFKFNANEITELWSASASTGLKASLYSSIRRLAYTQPNATYSTLYGCMEPSLIG
jgi:hypothetical protein